MRLPFLAAIISLVFLAAPARAQKRGDFPLRVEVTAGFGRDEIAPGWIPVRVAVTRSLAPGEDRYRFRLSARARYSEAQSALVGERRESIAPGTTKVFWMYAYLDEDTRQLALTVEDPHGERAADLKDWNDRTTFAIREPGASQGSSGSKEPLVIGVLSGRNPSCLNVLKSVDLPHELSAETIPLEPGDVPDRRIGLAPLDLLVLNDPKLQLFTPEQLEAIRCWTLGGGHLMISPGPDAGLVTQPFFHDLLPPGRAEIETRDEFGGAAVPPYPALRFTTEAREIETSHVEASLLGRAWRRIRGEPSSAEPGTSVTFRAGLGRVTLLPIDVSGAPLNGASLKDRLDEVRASYWQSVLLGFRARPPRGGELGGDWPVAAWPHVSGAAHDLLVPPREAPIYSIAVLALAYVTLVGPVNFLLLRRIGREPLVVFTIPAIAILSVLATFTIGTAVLGAGSRVYEATLIRARAGERFGLAERLVAIVPSRARHLELPLGRREDGVAVCTEQGDAGDRGFTIEEKDRFTIRDLAVARWEAGVFRAESLRDLEGGISFEAAGVTGAAVLRNGSALALRDVVVHTAGGMFRVKEIEPGASAELRAPVARDDAELGARRGTLEGRLAAHAEEWIWSQRGSGSSFRLSAHLSPGALEDGTPAPDERGALLLLEP